MARVGSTQEALQTESDALTHVATMSGAAYIAEPDAAASSGLTLSPDTCADQPSPSQLGDRLQQICTPSLPYSGSPERGGRSPTPCTNGSSPEERFLTASGNSLDPDLLPIDLDEASEDLAAQAAYLAALTQDDVKPDPDPADAAHSSLEEQRHRAVSPHVAAQIVTFSTDTPSYAYLSSGFWTDAHQV